MQKAKLDELESQAAAVLEGEDLKEALSDIAMLRAVPSVEDYMAQFSVTTKRPPVFTVRSWRDVLRLVAAAIVMCTLAVLLIFLFVSAGGWLVGGLPWSETGVDITIALTGSLLSAGLLYWLMPSR